MDTQGQIVAKYETSENMKGTSNLIRSRTSTICGFKFVFVTRKLLFMFLHFERVTEGDDFEPEEFAKDVTQGILG